MIFAAATLTRNVGGRLLAASRTKVVSKAIAASTSDHIKPYFLLSSVEERNTHNNYKNKSRRLFHSSTLHKDGKLADICQLNIVRSPFPAIPDGPYEPLPEFVMSKWKKWSNITAIIDGSTGMERTFDDFYNSTCGIAASLKYEFDISEKSCVCLFAPNHVDYLPVTVGVGLCGAKITPVNPLYKKDELQVILDRSHSTVLIAHQANLDIALEAAQASKYVKHILVMTEDSTEDDFQIPEGVIPLSQITSHSKAFDKTVRELHPETDHHPYLLPYSSGTTGLPKGVCLSHANLVSNLLQYGEIEKGVFLEGQKLISPLPFFHIYGMTVSILHTAWNGNPVITMSGRFDFEMFLKLVDQHKPDRAHLVPPIMVGLAKHPLVDQYDTSSIKCIISAAAPLGVQTQKAVEERLQGNCVVKQAWGMSELSPIGTCNTDSGAKPASVGPVVSNTYGKIIDDEGKSLPANTPGELVLKGPQVMMGYLDDPDNTAECLSKSGWLRTGDVAYYDDDGHFFITDRIKELIKVRGFQVAPAELEELLLTNEMVADVAVIQIPDEASGELPRAYVVLKDPTQNTEETKTTIYEWVKEKVVPYKRLDGGIVFVDTIPKSASGKILRRLIRDELAKELAAKISSHNETTMD